MVKIVFSREYFNIKDSLECGQYFRFTPYNNGFLVNSSDKLCFCYEEGENTLISCNDVDKDYFFNFFDLSRDYAEIFHSAISEGVEILTKSAEVGKGIRIFNQSLFEVCLSFIISQNNNITRIKNTINKLCIALGEEKNFNDITYYAFPTPQAISLQSVEFLKGLGLGYRAEYVKNFALMVVGGFDLDGLNNLSTSQIKESLLSIHGIGPKVADCIALFGYHRSDSFPVDTWMEKVYHDHFNGILADRKKITAYFVDRFKDNSGYYQQYLFHYKRNIYKK